MHSVINLAISLLRKFEGAFFNYPLFWGLLFFCGGVGILFVFKDNMNFYISLNLAFVWLGIILLLEYVSNRFLNFTFRINNEKRFRTGFKIVVSGFCFIVLQDIFGGIFPRLWVYTIWSPMQYAILAPIAYIVYSFGLVMAYIIMKKFLEKNLDINNIQKDIDTKGYFGGILYLIVGITLFLYTIFYTSYYISSNWGHFLNFNSPLNSSFEWWYPFLPYLSLFFICEFICGLQKKMTLLHTILRKNFIPLFAIIFASLIGIAAFEITNTPFLLWNYSDWPVFEYRFFEIPLLAIIWWPIQFVALLSLIRCVLRVEELDIW